MTDPNAVAPAEPTIDLASLGTYTDDDPEAPPPPEPVKAVEAPVAEPEKPAAEPAKPAPAVADDEDDEDLTFEDLDEIVRGASEAGAKQAIEAIRKADAEPTDDTPPETKKLAEENAALKAKLAEQENQIAESQRTTALADLEHSIASTIGKLKMTDAEVEAVTKYMTGNPDLTRGGMGFEEAASRRYPGIADRAKAAPASPATPAADGGSLVAPAANGAGAPKPWKPAASPGDYSDVSAHILKSGGAASLGKYT